MRFTIAAAVLTSTLPASAERTVDILRADIAEQLSPKQLLGRVVPHRRPRPNSGKATRTPNWGKKKRAAAVSRLKNSRVQSSAPPPPLECDPDVGLLACGFGRQCQASNESSLGGFCTALSEASPKECNPDVGLLACGHGRYCYTSNESSLGGFCSPLAPGVEHRGLQGDGVELGPGAYCDPDFAYYGLLDCDCSEWDGDSGSGTVVCQLYENYCIPFCPDANTCYSLEATYTNDGVNYPLNLYCYDIATPISQYFCYGNVDAETCLISVDGTECTRCSISFQENCNYGVCYQEPCFNYDCTNIGLGIGNTCESVVFPPAFDECLETLVPPPDPTAPSIGVGAYCDPNSETYGQLSCDCSGFDGRTGTITCSILEDYCIPECSTKTCFSEELNYTTDGVDLSSIYCYNVTAPYQQEFCFGVTGSNTCSISLNGVECSSCVVIAGESEKCYAYDCANIGLRTGLSCVDFPEPPALGLCTQAPPTFIVPPVSTPDEISEAPSLPPEAVTEAPSVGLGDAENEAPTDPPEVVPPLSPTAGPLRDATESPTGASFKAPDTDAPTAPPFSSAVAKADIFMLGATALVLSLFSC